MSSAASVTEYITLLNLISNKINLYMSSILFALGMISCIFILLIFSQRTFQHIPCAIYIQIKAIYDLISLFVGVVMRAYTGGTDIDPSRTNDVWCRLRTSLLYISALGSLSCICLTGFDRWISTSRSVQRRSWSSRRVAYFATITMTIISILLAGIPMAIMFAPVGSPPVCSYTTLAYADYSGFFFFPFVFGILPIVIPCLFGVLTYRNIRLFIRRVPRIERQLTRMLLLQLIALTLASIPYTIFCFYAASTRRLTKDSLRLAKENLFMTIIRNFFYINHAYTLYIFIMSSSEFQLIFKRFLLRSICCQTTHGVTSIRQRVPLSHMTKPRSNTIPLPH